MAFYTRHIMSYWHHLDMEY